MALQATLNTAFASQLASEGVRARWVAPHKLHLTLRFLGALPAASLDELGRGLAQVAATAPAFELALGGLGSFTGRVLWHFRTSLAPSCQAKRL